MACVMGPPFQLVYLYETFSYIKYLNRLSSVEPLEVGRAAAHGGRGPGLGIHCASQSDPTPVRRRVAGRKTMGKRIDTAALAPVLGTLYPAPFDLPCRARERRRLGDAAHLSQFGVNLLRLPAGAWSSQRHWHSRSDEFVYVLAGEVVLVTDAGEEVLRAGDAAGFKAGDENGHCLQNQSNKNALVLEIGTRVADDSVRYSDIDMVAPAGGKPAVYTHRDGTPYTDIKRRGPDQS